MGSTQAATSLSYQLTFGIVGMVLLTVFIIIFFIVYNRRLLEQKFHIQKIEADHQKDLLDSSILSQEEERSRMAIELHDSVGGLLSATKLYVSNISQDVSSDQFDLYKSKALITLNENIEEIRNITSNLMPQSLEQLGVIAATRLLIQRLIDLKQIEVDFDVTSEKRFEAIREKALFRILQELVNNTIKHSNARKVSIAFHFDREELSLTYQDNGQGFDLQQLESKGSGLGLKSIQSRAAFLNGKSEFQTAPGHGLTYTITIQL